MNLARLALPFSPESSRGRKRDAVQDYRDILKSAVVMQDDTMAYIISGIENQTDVHYAMPVRNMIYNDDEQRMLIDANTALVIHAVTNTKFKVNDDSEVIDMCKAIEDMMAESAAEGRLAGIAEGKVYAFAGLVRDGLLSLNEAARRAEMSPADFEAAAKKLS